MAKTLRKGNGQFNGSIGDGGKNTPTAPPTAAAQARVQDAEAALQAAQRQMLLAQAALHKAMNDPALVRQREADEAAAADNLIASWKYCTVPGDLYLSTPTYEDRFDEDEVRALLKAEDPYTKEYEYDDYLNDQQQDEMREYTYTALESAIDGTPSDEQVDTVLRYLEDRADRPSRTAWVAERTLVYLNVPLTKDEWGYATEWIETPVAMSDALNARHGRNTVVGGVRYRMDDTGGVTQVGPANVELSDILVRDSAHVTVTRFMYDHDCASEAPRDGAPTYTAAQVYPYN